MTLHEDVDVKVRVEIETQLEVEAQLDTPTDKMLLVVGADVVPVSNLEKPLWPDGRRQAVTKRELLRYFNRISPWLLPHLAGRPVSVTRFPHGVDGKSFYQRVWDDRPPFVETVPIWSKDNGRAREYLLVGNLATLLWLGQQAVLEIHPWMSRITADDEAKPLSTRYDESADALESSRLNYPDVIAIDLDAYLYSGGEDPGEEPALHRRGFNRVREIALVLHEAAASLDLPVFVKTSGRTGLHCYIPIRRRFTFDEVRGIAADIGRFLQSRRPDDVTLAWAVRDRTGKVFVDANQNVLGKSLAAAYSPRRHPLATVSMPVTWEELPQVYPTDFTVRTVPDLLEANGDRWAGLLQHKADLSAIMERLPSARPE